MPSRNLPYNLWGGILLICLLLSTEARAQDQSRTPLQRTNVVLDGERFVIEWYFGIALGKGTIAAQENGYYISTRRALDELKPRIFFSTIPDSITILASKDWTFKNSTMTVRGSCVKRSWKDATRIVMLEPSGELGDVTIRCRVVRDNSLDCKSEGTDIDLFIRLTDTAMSLQAADLIPDSSRAKPIPDSTTANDDEDPWSDSESSNSSNEGEKDARQNQQLDTLPTISERQVPPTPLVKSAEQIAFEKALKEGTLAGYLDFNDAYPNSKYTTRVKREIARRTTISVAKIQNSPNGFSVYLRNVTEPAVVAISDSLLTTKIVRSGQDITQHLAVLEVSVPSQYEKNVIVTLDDPTKVMTGDRQTKIHLGDHLIARVEFNADKSTVEKIYFDQGQPPYQVYFKRNNQIVETVVVEDADSWSAPVDFFKTMIGAVTIEITDGRQSTPLADPDWQFVIRDQRPNLWVYMAGLTLLFGLLLIVWPVANARKRNRRRQAYTEQRLEKWQDHMERIQAERGNLLDEAAVVIEEGGNAFEEKMEIESTPTVKKASGIRIKKITKASDKVKLNYDPKELEKILKADFTVIFTMNPFWEDSAIAEVIFTRGAQEQLDTFLHRENLRPLQEHEGQIPEIGGILMGRPFINEVGQFRVLVEEFIPIAPEYHDTYQLEFSADSLARDLGQAQDQHPSLMLVGWFHTHPGHGLFLSRPDLRIHDTFFKKSYQFAMEIDSLTARLDTGFFTRMQNGKVNNRRNLRPGAEWYSWIETENAN